MATSSTGIRIAIPRSRNAAATIGPIQASVPAAARVGGPDRDDAEQDQQGKERVGVRAAPGMLVQKGEACREDDP